MDDPLVETWAIHARINHRLLDAVAPAALDATLLGKGRSVRDQFCHIHNVRLLWLRASAPASQAPPPKLDPKAPPDVAAIHAALASSDSAVSDLLRASIASGGRIRNVRPHACGFLGYLISHESHHRGQVGWTLKHSGHPLDKASSFGLWDWGGGSSAAR